MLGALRGYFLGRFNATHTDREAADDGSRPDSELLPEHCLQRGMKCSAKNCDVTLAVNSTAPKLDETGFVHEPRQHSTLNGRLDRSDRLEIEKQDFLNVFGHDYGYDGRLEAIRLEDFSRLAGQVYLDYAGAALYSERQIQACSEELLTTLLCNPHSAPSSTSADALAALRRDTLHLLNADGRQYDVVLTSGATAALKLVAESFPWCPGASRFAHPSAVHNSVLGMRGPALAAGAAIQLVQMTAPAPTPRAAAVPTAVDSITEQGLAEAAGKAPQGRRAAGGGVQVGGQMTAAPAAANIRNGTSTADAGADGTAAAAPSWNLLALSAECNFTGDREQLADVVRHVQQYGISAGAAPEDEGSDAGGGSGRWMVLLDAAKACATAPPDLAVVPADFVVLSYYKIFGHPTGLGALVARKAALALLAGGKSYFGGGTVEVAVADRPYHVRRSGAAGLEDGTPPFTAIAAARHGFAFLRRLGGLPAVHRHTCCLARWLAARLGALRHANGAPVCVLYGRWCAAIVAAAVPDPAAASGGVAAAAAAALPDHGPVVSFNLLRPDGRWVGYAEVGRLAAMHGLHVRTGCFCNPGACAEWLGLTGEDLIANHSAGHVCWDEHDLLDGRPTGAVRVSLGAATAFADVYALLQLIRRYFVDDGEEGGGGSTVPAQAQAPSTPLIAAAAKAPPAAGLEMDPTGGMEGVSDASGGGREAAPLGNICGGGGAAAGAAGPRAGAPAAAAEGQLSRILLYPVKSCAAQQVAAWPVGPTGLLYDREWALVDDNGWVLTLKQCPRMALVRPRVDLTRGTLTIAAPGDADVAPLELAIPGLFRHGQRGGSSGAGPGHGSAAAMSAATTDVAAATAAAGAPAVELPASAAPVAADVGPCVSTAVWHRDAVQLDAGLTTERVKVCGDTVCSDLVDACHDSEGDARVRQWFVRVLGAPCRIVQQRIGARKVRRPAGQGPAAAAAALAAAAVPGPAEKAQLSSLPQQQRGGTSSSSGSSWVPERNGHDGSGGDSAAAGSKGGLTTGPLVGFANDGQYLLVSEASMDDLRARLRQGGGDGLIGRSGGSGGAAAGDTGDDLLARLRPNLVVTGFGPYEEDRWAAVTVGQLRADVLGACPRCELLQVDPRVGVRRGAEVLVALAQYRRRGGRVQFGILLAAVPTPSAAAVSAPGTAVRVTGEAATSVVSEGDSGCCFEAAGPCVGWLRREFGPLSVVAVGDRVRPDLVVSGEGGAALRLGMAVGALV